MNKSVLGIAEISVLMLCTEMFSLLAQVVFRFSSSDVGKNNRDSLMFHVCMESFLINHVSTSDFHQSSLCVGFSRDLNSVKPNTSQVKRKLTLFPRSPFLFESERYLSDI